MMPLVQYAQLLDTLATQAQLPKPKVKAIISGMIALAAQELKSGKQVQFGELGRLRLRDAVGLPAAGDKAGKRAVLILAKTFREAVES